MLRNYLKVAARNLVKNKLHSFITIFGLAFGMACFLLIFGYVQFENSYNDFHENAKNIYRLDKKVQAQGYSYYRSLAGATIGPLLRQQFPAIRNIARFGYLPACLVDVNENVYREKRFLFSDSSVFAVFTFPLKIGDSKTALSNPFSVVITPQTAKKYFGNENPIGKTIYFQVKELPGKFGFTVTGILEDIPSNSTIKFDFLASFSSFDRIVGKAVDDMNWDGPVWTYVQLQDNYDPKKLEALFPSFAEKNIPKTSFSATTFRLVPLKDTYYDKGDGLPLMDWGIKPVSYLLLVVSFLVLFIACINYTNLLSAQSVTRTKEIGVRKAQGASRLQLIIQFIGESVLVSLLSFLLAIALVELLLPSFKSVLNDAYPSFGILAKRDVDFNIFNPRILAYMLATSIIVGILSGIYPALILSRHNAALVLKGERKTGTSSALMRKILVITQFTVSVIFITCSLHILLQIQYWKNADLGFDKDNLIVLPVYDNSVKEKYDLFKNKLLQSTSILGVTSSNLIPGGQDANYCFLRSGTVKDLWVATYYVDKDFIRTLKLKVSEGRDFSSSIPDDQKSAILMNQAAVKACGWNEVGGQEIELYTKETDKADVLYTGKAIGEVDNFQFRFFEPTDAPLILKINPEVMNYILIRTNKASEGNAIDDIKSAWKAMGFEQSFEYSYLTDELEDSYSIVEAFDSFIRFGAIITIIIASLGLFGLASFVIDRKTKEIGIRKVMGASVKDIIYRLAKSFVAMVVIANIIGLLVSFEATSWLLQQLPNHIGINIWVLLTTFVFLVIFSSFIVGIKSFNAASANPVKSLRYE